MKRSHFVHSRQPPGLGGVVAECPKAGVNQVGWSCSDGGRQMIAPYPLSDGSTYCRIWNTRNRKPGLVLGIGMFSTCFMFFPVEQNKIQLV